MAPDAKHQQRVLEARIDENLRASASMASWPCVIEAGDLAHVIDVVVAKYRAAGWDIRVKQRDCLTSILIVERPS
jgi:hypothetical protein